MSEMERTDGTVVFLCECGPIIKDLIDLDTLGERAAGMEHVKAVVKHSTLCSADGKAFITKTLEENPGLRPVFAACTPREHAETLGSACEAAGVNRYLMGRANIREQCAWVHSDKIKATEKAEHLVKAAVERALVNQPLVAPEIECATDVMVIGAGIAGLNAAKLLAEAGRKVTLIEREPAIGGRIVQLGELYPDMDCAPCLLEPLMDKVLHHPNIEVLLQSELEDLLGYLGNYTARIRVRSRHVEIDGCYACRACSEVCPASVPDPVNNGMTTRKAVHIPFEGALPNASVIDESACLHFNGGECDACVSACAFGAISLDGEDRIEERSVGGVLIATGSDIQAVGSVWDSPAVLTTMEFERILNPDGPTGGEVRLPGTEAAPTRIALVHCATAEATAPVATCSNTCCLSLAKAALEVSHKAPDVHVTTFAWDRVLGGPHFLARAAENHGHGETVRMAEGDTLRVEGNGAGARVILDRSGSVSAADFDIVVMAAPQCGSTTVGATAAAVGLELDRSGFVPTANHRLSAFASRIEGVYVGGSAQGPKDVTAAATSGAAAAGAMLSALVEGKRLVREAATATVDESLCGGCAICALTCPYKAITFDSERKVAVVNELLCHGCGTCVAACPSAAITAKHFSDTQLFAEAHALAWYAHGSE